MPKVRRRTTVILLVQCVALAGFWFWTRDSATQLVRQLYRNEVKANTTVPDTQTRETSMVDVDIPQTQPTTNNETEAAIVEYKANEGNDTLDSSNTKPTTPNNTSGGKLVGKENPEDLKIAQRLEERRSLVHATCIKLQPKCYIETPVKYRDLFFHDYNTTVCTIAKAGSSTWRTHVRRVNKGPPPHVPIDQEPRYQKLLARPIELVSKDANASAKIMTVRHPFTRLVSAYRQKFKSGRKMPPHRPEVEKAKFKTMTGNSWQQRFYQFWLPAMYNNDLIPPDLHTRLGLPEPIDPAVRYETPVYEEMHRLLRPRITFTQFLRHVIITFRNNTPDAHWSNYVRECCPCLYDYQYITKIETLSDDLVYVFKALGIPSDPSTAENMLRKSLTSYHDDFSIYNNVPANVKHQIYNIFRWDFEMFGYKVPKGFLDN